MKYLYEFIGTFFLVLTIGMTVINPNSIGPFAPLAIGTALAIMIYAGGHISGGHYNPAVSFAVYLRGKLKLNEMGFYWLSQCAGALLAGCLTIYFKGHTASIPLDIANWKAFIAEFLFTFALCFMVLNVATAKATQGNSYFGWAIGFTVMVGAFCMGAVSGGAFNPAVALGLSLMKLTFWKHIWVFILSNLLGAAVAALVFKAAHKEVSKQKG